NNYLVNTGANKGGSISNDSVITLDSNYRLFITPETGFKINYVVINNVAIPLKPSIDTTFSVNKNYNIYVNFVKLYYKIIPNSNVGGAIVVRSNGQQTNTIFYGDNANVFIRPYVGYSIDSIFINEKYNALIPINNNETNNYNFNNVLGDSTIRVVFKKTRFKVNIRSSNGGRLSVNGNITVANNANVTLQIQARYGFYVDSIFVNGKGIRISTNNNQITNTNFILKNIQGDSTIYVQFKQNSFTITSSTKTNTGLLPYNGYINPEGENMVGYGQNKTYQIQSYFPYILDSVIINGNINVNNNSNATGLNYTFKNVLGDSNIYATFKRYAYLIKSSTVGGGRLNIPSNYFVKNGKSVTINFVANTNKVLDSVTINGNKILVTNNTLTIENMNEDKLLVAYFKNGVAGNAKVVDAISTPKYSIVSSCNYPNILNYEGTYWVDSNTSLVYNFNYNKNEFSIDSVLLDGILVANQDSFVLNNINSNHTIQLILKPLFYTISSIINGQGSLNTVGQNKITKGDYYTYTFKSELNATLDSVLVDDILVNPININNNETLPNDNGAGYYYIDTNGNAQYTFNNIEANHTFRVVFKQHVFSITSTVNGKGIINTLGTIQLNSGDNYQYQFSDESGSMLDSIVVDGVAIRDSFSSYTFSNIQANHTIQLMYSNSMYNITTTSNNQIAGNIELNNSVNLEANTYNTIPIKANAGYVIDSIIVNNESIQVENKYMVNYVINALDKNYLIRVVYAVEIVAIIASSGNNGVITPSGTNMVNYGENKLYSFTPAMGYLVDSIIVDGILQPRATTYLFENITSNHTIKVTFKPQLFIITSSAGTGGSISPQGTAIVNYGETPTYIITPNTGFVIDSLLVNGNKITNVNSYTFDTIKSNQTIRVTFKPSIVCPIIKVTPNIVRVGITLQSDITTFAKHRWYLDGIKKDSTIINSYTPQTAGVYTLLGLDANGCESNLSKKYYFAQSCLTPTGRLGNGAYIQSNIINNG
ncbi:MAG: hypothetical protein ORN58_03930, partial [Sediminibacterium sp.]|nr:hypothetical protein [Sediminibacterium sp.]